MQIMAGSMIKHWSIQHALSAASLTRRAIEVERLLAEDRTNAVLVSEVVANVSGVLFLTVAFLEALANEMFADATTENGGHLSRLPSAVLEELAVVANDPATERAPTLSKYGILLTAAHKRPIGFGAAPGQHVRKLLWLRNELVHSKAPWLDADTSKSLHERKGENDLAKDVTGSFSFRVGASSAEGTRWMSAACAKWSIASALAFTDEAYKRLGVVPLYASVRQDFAP